MASRPPDERFDPTPASGQEKAHFAVINVVRLSGVALILIGILVLRGALDLPEIVGWVFVPVGLVEFFVMPLLLARKWRTPPR